MSKTIIAILALLTSAFAQTTLKGPVTITPPTGSPNVTIWDFSQASSLPGCPTLASQPSAIPNPLRICTTGGIPYADSGAGYASLQGPKGDSGAQGPAGKDGANGTSATVSVGTVTSLAASSKPTVTNSGSSSSAILNFGIPAGAAGKAGTWPSSFTCSTQTRNKNGSTTFSGCK